MSVDSIQAILLDSISDKYQKTAGYPMWMLTRAMALGLDSGDTAIQQTAEKLDPENLSGAELEQYIYYRTGQSRTQAVIASGTVTVTGKGEITAGNLFVTDGGVLFESGDTVTVDGSADVRVSCMTEGTIGNVPAGAICKMPVQIPGITSVTNAAPTDGGYDAESDADLLERFITHLQNPPNGANAWQYREWATNFAGVGDAKIFPLGHGDGTVDVVLIGTDGKPASETLVRQVQNYIDPGSNGFGEGAAPIGAACYVSAATARSLNVAARIKLLDDAEQEATTKAVTESLENYLKKIAFKQTYVSLARLGEAILDAAGVADYESLTVDGATSNVQLSARQVAVLGNLAVTYAT